MSNTVKLVVLKEIVDLFRRIKKQKRKSYVKLEWLMKDGSDIEKLKEGIRRLCELGVFTDEGEGVKKIFYLNNERFPLQLSDEVMDVAVVTNDENDESPKKKPLIYTQNSLWLDDDSDGIAKDGIVDVLDDARDEESDGDVGQKESFVSRKVFQEVIDKLERKYDELALVLSLNYSKCSKHENMNKSFFKEEIITSLKKEFAAKDEIIYRLKVENERLKSAASSQNAFSADISQSDELPSYQPRREVFEASDVHVKQHTGKTAIHSTPSILRSPIPTPVHARPETYSPQSDTPNYDLIMKPALHRIPARSERRRPQVVCDEKQILNNVTDFHSPTARTVPGNSSYARITNKGKMTACFTDSHGSRIKGKTMSDFIDNGSAIVRPFPGCSSNEMKTYVLPTLKANTPDKVIIHVGCVDILRGGKGSTENRQ